MSPLAMSPGRLTGPWATRASSSVSRLPGKYFSASRHQGGHRFWPRGPHSRKQTWQSAADRGTWTVSSPVRHYCVSFDSYNAMPLS